MPTRRHPRAAVAVAVTLGAWALAACGRADEALPAGPNAGSPACARLIAALPARVLDQPRGESSGDGAATWGSPPVVLACGQPPHAATTAACVGVDDVDWIVDDPDADPLRFTTFGRSPTVVVLVPARYGRDRATAALVDLGAAVGSLPRQGPGCS